MEADGIEMSEQNFCRTICLMILRKTDFAHLSAAWKAFNPDPL